MTNASCASQLSKVILLASVLLLSSDSFANAELFKHTSGQIIKGKIIERDIDTVKIATDLGVAVTYFLDEIEVIDEIADESNINGEIESKKIYNRIETVEILEPIELLAPSAPQAISQPIKDISVLEERNRSKEILSPFGPTIKENQSAYVGVLSDTGNNILHRLIGMLRLDQIRQKVGKGALILLCSIFACFYILVCYPLARIAKKLRCENRWLIWVPVVHLIYIIYMAKKPFSWCLLYLIPIINLITLIILFASILRNLKKTTWLAPLIIIPGINVVLLWYLALLKPKFRQTVF